MTATILCGHPGSGKSTWAQEKSKHGNYIIINQDLLSSRKICLERMEFWLKQNVSIIVDRTNISKQQRSYFIELAKKYKANEINCVIFKSDPEECIKRILKRKNHPTITEDFTEEKIREIIYKFVNSYEDVTNDEGFDRISTFHIDTLLGQKDSCIRD